MNDAIRLSCSVCCGVLLLLSSFLFAIWLYTPKGQIVFKRRNTIVSHLKFFAFIMLFATLSLCCRLFEKRQPATVQPRNAGVVCKRVVDGDTIKLSDGRTVRLVGVDTPETVDPHRPAQFGGKEASQYVKKRAEGQIVRVEYDEKIERADKYGRELAYVYIGDAMLNEELVKLGYGRVYREFPFSRMSEFLSMEETARRNKLGVWNDKKRDAAKTVCVSGGSYHETTCPMVALRLTSKQDAVTSALVACDKCKP